MLDFNQIFFCIYWDDLDFFFYSLNVERIHQWILSTLRQNSPCDRIHQWKHLGLEFHAGKVLNWGFDLLFNSFEMIQIFFIFDSVLVSFFF